MIRFLLLHLEGVEEVDLSTYPEEVQVLHMSWLVEAGLTVLQQVVQSLLRDQLGVRL